MISKALVFTHVALFSAAVWLGWRSGGQEEVSGEDQSMIPRVSDYQVSAADDAADSLLKQFLPGESAPRKSQYDQVRVTLDALDDNEARLRSILVRLPAYYLPRKGRPAMSPGDFGASTSAEIDGSDGKLVAEFEARVAHWLRTDRDACIGFLKESLMVGGAYEVHPINRTVLADYLSEGDFSEKAKWINAHSPFLVDEMLKKKVEEGGGLEILETLDELEIGRSGYFAYSVARNLPFSNREEILAIALESDQSISSAQGRSVIMSFLRNEDHPPEQVIHWLNGLVDEDRIPESLRESMSREVGEWIKEASSLSHDERIVALEKWGRKPESPYAELATRDIGQAIEEGRDWTYEFRHGRVSVEEVWNNLSEQLPPMNEAAEKAARINLYRTLAEEDFLKAQALIEGFPEEEKRSILFQTNWRSFANVHPQKLLEFGQSMPPPETARERRDRLKGWEWRTRSFLSRHGEDYVEWVLQMPDGPDKKEAQRGLVWGTMETDPVRGDLLRARLEATSP